MLVQHLRLLFVELQLEQARLAMEDGHRVAGLVQVGRGFAADQAAADHRPARLRTARQAFRAAAAQREQIVEAVERKEVRSRWHEDGWYARGRARREDQHVVL